MNRDDKKETALVAVPQKSVELVKKDGYWGYVASRYTLVKRILLIALVLFIVFFMIFFSRAFTYDSLFSFFKDLQSVAAFLPSDYQTVTATYHEGGEVVLSYRGGVAFVNSTGIEIYSPDGKRLLDVEEDFNNPRAVASRKYLLAYDHGGTGFTVTNAYSELCSEEMLVPLYDENDAVIGETKVSILGAAISDSGHFALITTPNHPNALSAVWLYDSNFNLIQSFKRASATVGVAISDNGRRIALLGAGADEGKVSSKLDLFLIGESEAEASVVLTEEIPLSIAFTDNKHLVFLTDYALTFADLDLEWKERTTLDDRRIVDFTADENGAALVLEEDALHLKNRIVVFDDAGKLLYQDIFSGDVKAVALEKEVLFLLSDGSVERYDLDKGTTITQAVNSGATDLFAVSDDGVRVIYPAKAEYYHFDEP